MNVSLHEVTLDELTTVLNAPALPGSDWVSRLCTASDVAKLSDDDILEIACEYDPANPHASIAGLIAGLEWRLQYDRAALAALAAIRDYLLPLAVDAVRG